MSSPHSHDYWLMWSVLALAVGFHADFDATGCLRLDLFNTNFPPKFKACAKNYALRFFLSPSWRCALRVLPQGRLVLDPSPLGEVAFLDSLFGEDALLQKLRGKGPAKAKLDKLNPMRSLPLS